MKLRHLVLVALLVAAAGLGWLVVTPPATDHPHLLPEQAGLAEQLRITGPDRKTVQLEQRDGHWWLTEPVTAPARAERVTGIAGIGQVASRARYAAAELDLAEIGLAPPRLTLTVDGQQLAFGADEPVSRQRYVRQGDTVHLTAPDLMPLAGQPWTELVVQQLLWPDQEVVRLESPSLGGRAPMGISRRDGGWHNAQGEAVADEAVDALLTAWHTEAAERVEPAGDRPARGRILVLLAGSDRPLRFDVIESESGLALRRRDLGLTYHFSADAAQRLLAIPGRR